MDRQTNRYQEAPSRWGGQIDAFEGLHERNRLFPFDSSHLEQVIYVCQQLVDTRKKKCT